MKTVNRVRNFSEGIVVLCENETDMDQYFWLVPMTGWELEEWWKNQLNFERDTKGDIRHLYQVLGGMLPEERKDGFPGNFLTTDEFEELALWEELAGDGCHYRCQLRCNSDSYLKRPDGEIIRHAGFVETQEGPLR